MQPPVERMCGDKRQHPTRKSAAGHRAALARHRRVSVRAFNVYRCPICGFWHVGHRRPR